MCFTVCLQHWANRRILFIEKDKSHRLLPTGYRARRAGASVALPAHSRKKVKEYEEKNREAYPAQSRRLFCEFVPKPNFRMSFRRKVGSEGARTPPLL